MCLCSHPRDVWGAHPRISGVIGRSDKDFVGAPRVISNGTQNSTRTRDAVRTCVDAHSARRVVAISRTRRLLNTCRARSNAATERSNAREPPPRRGRAIRDSRSGSVFSRDDAPASRSRRIARTLRVRFDNRFRRRARAGRRSRDGVRHLPERARELRPRSRAHF